MLTEKDRKLIQGLRFMLEDHIDHIEEGLLGDVEGVEMLAHKNLEILSLVFLIYESHRQYVDQKMKEQDADELVKVIGSDCFDLIAAHWSQARKEMKKAG
jgi:hypothetical protein